jgi:hypothetical protein
MPTEEETRKAEPVVKKMLAQERAALESSKKTRSEVAAAAMKLAGEADTDAAKLLLMKGAFVLYVRDGNLKKAVETMNALETAISDMPPQSITNMIETALLGVSGKVDGARLYELLDEAKVEQRQVTVDGYTWSYFVKNGEATVAAEKDGKYSCAVSPSPKGAITIPETLGGVKVTGIGMNLFRNCKDVTSVTIPEGVTSIGSRAFDFCVGLKSVTIPSSVKTIGEWAFSACFRLQPVTLPESLEYIGKCAFINCRSLKAVNIPAKLAEMRGGAFAYCTGLKQFNVDAKNETFTAIDGVLYSKDLSTLVSGLNGSTIAGMPSSVTKIGVSAFQGRDRLETLALPEGVTIIDRAAFHDCGRLGSATIPASVAKIGGRAFSNCGRLAEVTMLGERPKAADDIFRKCGKLKSIHVPANAKSWAGMKEWQGIPLVFDAK